MGTSYIPGVMVGTFILSLHIISLNPHNPVRELCQFTDEESDTERGLGTFQTRLHPSVLEPHGGTELEKNDEFHSFTSQTV